MLSVAGVGAAVVLSTATSADCRWLVAGVESTCSRVARHPIVHYTSSRRWGQGPATEQLPQGLAACVVGVDTLVCEETVIAQCGTFPHLMRGLLHQRQAPALLADHVRVVFPYTYLLLRQGEWVNQDCSLVLPRFELDFYRACPKLHSPPPPLNLVYPVAVTVHGDTDDLLDSVLARLLGLRLFAWNIKIIASGCSVVLGYPECRGFGTDTSALAAPVHFIPEHSRISWLTFQVALCF